MFSSEDICSLLNIAFEGSGDPQVVERALAERLTQLRQRVETAGGRHERRICKNDLKDFEQHVCAIEQYVAHLRFEILLERVESLIAEQQVRRAEVAWREARQIAENSESLQGRTGQLEDTWAGLVQAAEMLNLSVSQEAPPAAAPPLSTAAETPPPEPAVTEPVTEPVAVAPEPVPKDAPQDVSMEDSSASVASPTAIAPPPSVISVDLNVVEDCRSAQVIAETLPPCPVVDRLTLKGPEGELVHILKLDQLTFGRGDAAEVRVRAYSPHNRDDYHRVSQLLSRIHFTVVRETDDVCVYSGAVGFGLRKHAPNGILGDGVLFEQLQLFRTGTKHIQLLKPGLADNAPSWEIMLRMEPLAPTVLPAGYQPIVGPQALLLKRMDGLCEDVLLLWGSVDLQVLELSDRSQLMLSHNQGFYIYSDGAWTPVTSTTRLNQFWRVQSLGSLTYAG